LSQIGEEKHETTTKPLKNKLEFKNPLDKYKIAKDKSNDTPFAF